MTSPDLEQINAALATVNDPEIRRPITDLGMVESVDVAADGTVAVKVLLTVAGCPLKDTITRDVNAAVGKVPGVTGVDLTLGVMSNEQRSGLQEKLRGGQAQKEIPFARPGSLTKVYAIASGKGGVGKSSVTVNLAAAMAKQGMKILYSVPWPPQGIYSKRTLASVSDMKGLKWRAYSPATSKIAELVGAQPVTVQAAEVSQALATGVIDSYMSSGATGYDSKTYEHIKNWYDTQAWLPKNAVIVNAKAFDALDKPTQAAVLKAAADAETRGWKLSEEKNGWYVDQLKGKGMSIIKPSEQLTADLRRVGNYMLAEWQRKTGDDGKKVIDAYRAQQ